VDDFAAEVGFYTDILGLAVNALDPAYAMFTSPSADFYLAVVPTPPGGRSTPPDAMRIQFMVSDVLATARELEKRGIAFEQWPQPCSGGSALYVGYFRTPHGICVDVWGLVEVGEPTQPRSGEAAGDREAAIIPAGDPEAEEIEASIRDEAEGELYPEDLAREGEDGYSGGEEIGPQQGVDFSDVDEDEDETATPDESFIEAEVDLLLDAPDLEEAEAGLIEIEYVDEEDL
jgi:catechol 2,3-dioxygenase-like lactoylglutathione lyase family enzyme